MFPLSGFGSLAGFHRWIVASAGPSPRDCSQSVTPTSRLPRLRSPIASSQSGGAPSHRGSQPRCYSCLRPKSEHSGCALRVSHPLDALLPPRPAGLVPSRSRVWGSPFEALLRGERRADLSTRQDPPEVSDPLPSAISRERVGLASGPASPGLCSPTAASQRRLGIAPYAAAVASVGLSLRGMLGPRSPG